MLKMFSNVRQICKRLPTCWQRQKVIMFQNTFTPNVKPSEHVYYGMTSTFARSLSVQAGAPRGSTTYKPFHGYLGDLYAADRGAEGSCQILANFGRISLVFGCIGFDHLSSKLRDPGLDGHRRFKWRTFARCVACSEV